ncbi:MAG: YchF/TatD family DNA exonuclease [bacterium]|nr:YchF/TatD family DNA exonuclease [bacterium]
MSFFIDSHVHLDDPKYTSDREAVIHRAFDTGVNWLIQIGTDIPSDEFAIQLAEQYPTIYATVSIHPHDANAFDESSYIKLRTLAQHPKVVAIGETGLDYHYDFSPREIQRTVFRRLMELAAELNKPVVIHSRAANRDTLHILTEYQGKVTGVMHCFSGDELMMKECIQLGYYISIAGPVTYPNSARLQELVKKIPIPRLSIETDSPYLAPQSYRGKRNEPAYVIDIAKKIAELRGLTASDIGRIAAINAKLLFGISVPDEPKIAYPIRNSLYLNITNRCTNQCYFCVRFYTDYVMGHNLRLKIEPTTEEIIAAIGDPKQYEEVVFCGYGEPTLRLDVMKTVARWLKEQGVKVRLDTNGHGNLIHQRNIVPELVGLIDSVSISLDAENQEQYMKICKPQFGEPTFQAVIDFIKECKKLLPEVSVTVVGVPEVSEINCRKLADTLGVKFRFRVYNEVG